jgi:hypothetical protein
LKEEEIMDKKIILPRELDGRPKISYSQYSSYKDEEYQDQYYLQYFSNIRLPSGEFAEFGTSCGQFIEDVGMGTTPPRTGCLSKEDVEIILDKITFHPNSVYEDKIIVDCGDYLVEGYADRIKYLDNKEVEVEDFKTLNIDTKRKFYESEEYGQTALYSHQKEKEGYIVKRSFVTGLGRKGSSLEGTGNFKMRLSGVVEEIETPYTKERGEKVIEDITKVVHQISDDYKVFLKYFSAK